MDNNSRTNTFHADKIQEPTINLPKGGGAVRNIGDTFQPNFFSGAGSYSIPLPLSKARDFEPQLSLEYSSGSGNDVFGLGFSLTLAKISRKTSTGIPKYDDKDIFILIGEGELTPKLIEKDGQWILDETSRTDNGISWRVVSFLPRAQGSYSLIEQWIAQSNGESWWKVTSRDNVTFKYGKNASARISDPDNGTRIFEWLIEEAIDSKGNKIHYQYKPENRENVLNQVYEVNRSFQAKKYIERIKYGNYYADGAVESEKFAFEVVFDYGEYAITDLTHSNSNPYQPVREWSQRSDPFSTYRSGFEIRTFRLCRNVLIFHSFEELGSNPCLVKALRFDHNETPAFSFLQSVTQTGYRINPNGSYTSQSLPPLMFDYSQFSPPETPEFKPLTVNKNATIPGYFDKAHFQPIDLKGEGLPGMLLSNAETTLYYEPLGNGDYQPPSAPATFPSTKNFQNPSLSLQSLDGNGKLALVVNTSQVAGYYSQEYDNSWSAFRPFRCVPTDLVNRYSESVDLDGNGKADLLVFKQPDVVFYPSEGTSGYGESKWLPLPQEFPAATNYGEEELVTFADVFGDGLSHRVRIRDGSVEAWPNFGYGRFGEKVTLGNAPRFDATTKISRIFLADIDGSGTMDLVFAYANRVEIYLNQIGNSFADKPLILYLPESFSDIDSIRFSDVLGEGTSALVFTKAGSEMRHWYYNFCGERETDAQQGTLRIPALKPYLLTKINNNLGAITEIYYASSTKFYLDDKKAGNPWVTRLPFPVQVLEKTIVTDEISGSRLTSTYKYHDGYYDFAEKEFRGFGFVESWDTESFEEYEKSPSNPDFPSNRLNKELYVPPVYTKTWHHTGAFFEEGRITRQYEKQYFQGDPDAYAMPDSVLDSSILQSDPDTIRQAYAALKGTVLHQEIYALDDSAVQLIPYSVTESNFAANLIQPKGNQQYAAFYVHSRESIAYHYERNPNDPRVQQEFTLKVDPLCGKTRISCTVFLPRRSNSSAGATIYPEQTALKATAALNDYINTADTENYRYRGVPYQAQEFEIFGLELNAKQYFSYDDMLPVKSAVHNPVPYQSAIAAGQLAARQLTWQKAYYWNNEQTDFLRLSEIACHGLVHHNETAVLTKEYVAEIFGQQLSDDIIQTQGGYIYDEDSKYWWNKGLTQYYFDKNAPAAFYLPNKTNNAFVDSSSALFMQTTVEYDQPYSFLPVVLTQYIDAATKNIVTAEIDYITLQPKQVVDINGNVSQVLFDPLGQVIVSSLFGTENDRPAGGMRLFPYGGKSAEYVRRDDDSFDNVLHNSEKYLQGASSYFYYDLLAWQENKQPPCSINLIRDDFFITEQGASEFACKTAISYSDGFGRTLESKLQTDSNWVVSGRTVYNNKGKATEQYLPYFSNTAAFEPQQEIVAQKLFPPPTVTHYDPLLRIIRVDTPKGFFSKTEFTPWEEKHYDEDDTVKDSAYYRDFMANYPPDPTQSQKDEKDALYKAAVFYDTPAMKVLDNAGKMFLDIQTLADKRQLVAYTLTDIQGRPAVSIDPRLYHANQTTGSNYYNFKYRYAMGDKDPVHVDSIDAGVEKHLNNIYGNQLWSLSSRNYCQLISYDQLQRRSAVKVKKLADNQPITSYGDFRLVEVFEYGEAHPELTGRNLRGQLYRLKDLSGIVINSQYSLLGGLLETSRQMAANYKTAIDWNSISPPLLEKEIYTSRFTYNALNNLITETSPDGSITINSYNRAGLLNQINTIFNDKSEQQIIKLIDYDANGQRTSVHYGNGIKTNYSYEPTTLRLTQLLSTRSKNSGTETVQDVDYTYDPVGNITRSRNNTFKTVFGKNQAVNPLSDYSYDALYRLTAANGRQHPGINAGTYKNNIADKDFKQCLFSQLPNTNDADKLENYHEAYSYDDSGNLIKKKHIAASSTWTKATPVEDDSNRLKGLKYDASGNLRQLEINNPVNLTFNCCENLVKAAIIERPDELDDADYYVYDSNELRTRKVSERMTNAGVVTRIEEKIYLGNYEIKRSKSVDAQGTETLTQERQSLRIMDDGACVLVMNNCVIGKEAGTRKLRFQMSDNLGSVAAEYDKDAQLISYEEYFPYGGTAIIAGASQAEVKLKDYRYSGKECDDSTGLYYYGVRYYAPWLGRWLNPDPAKTVDGLNLFAFVGGNPVSHVDIGGMMKRKRSRSISIDTGEEPETVPKLFSITLKTGADWTTAHKWQRKNKTFDLTISWPGGEKKGTVEPRHASGDTPNQFFVRHEGFGGGQSTKYTKFTTFIDGEQSSDYPRISSRLIKGTLNEPGKKLDFANDRDTQTQVSRALLFGALANTSEWGRHPISPFVALVVLGYAKKVKTNIEKFVKAYLPAPSGGADVVNQFGTEFHELAGQERKLSEFEAFYDKYEDFFKVAGKYLLEKKKDTSIFTLEKDWSHKVKTVVAFAQYKVHLEKKYPHLGK